MKYNFKLRSREILDLLIEFTYLAIIFFVPIYFSVFLPTYNVFELSKLFIFKILTYLLLFLSVLKLTFFRAEFFLSLNKIKGLILFNKKYWLPLFIFIVGLGISLLFSINHLQSFFGSYDRQAGYLSYLFYFLWFCLLFYNIQTLNNHSRSESSDSSLKLNIHRILLVAVLSSFVVSVYGILQRLGIDFLTWPEDPLFTGRSFSSFGQPNFLASWLLLIIPLAAYLIIKSKKFLTKLFYSLILFSQLICLFLTASRGALVAFVLMVFVFAIYTLKKINVSQKSKIIISLSFFLLILLGVFIFSFNSPERVKGLMDFKTGSMGARVNYYSAALEAIGQKPFFGYGLDNGAQAFFPYYQSDWGIHANIGISSDRAHNLILDILLGGGILNLVLFILLYYYFFSLAFKNIVNNSFSGLSLAISFGVFAYLISLLFNFSFVGSEIYFFLFLALLLLANLHSEDDKNLKNSFIENKLSSISVFGTLIAFLIFILIALGINYEFRVLKADHYFGAMYKNLNSKQYFTAFTLAEYAGEENTNIVNQAYYNRALADIISSDYPQINDVLSRMIIKKQLQEIDKKLTERGYLDILVKGKINLALGDYSNAKKYFQKITNLSPYWPEAYVQLGEVLTKEKLFKEAIINYQLVLKILPDVKDPRFNEEHRNFLKNYQKNVLKKIADIYFELHDYETAESYYQLAYSTNFQDISLFKNIADTYYLRGDFSKAKEYNLRGTRRAPNDYRWPLSLAILYKENGDKIKAHDYFQKAFDLAPEEELLIQLKAEY